MEARFLDRFIVTVSGKYDINQLLGWVWPVMSRELFRQWRLISNYSVHAPVSVIFVESTAIVSWRLSGNQRRDEVTIDTKCTSIKDNMWQQFLFAKKLYNIYYRPRPIKYSCDGRLPVRPRPIYAGYLQVAANKSNPLRVLLISQQRIGIL